jgi:NAD(P)-dependent dehydrogenase (short-subunit alcohol dehydrogenase family)
MPNAAPVAVVTAASKGMGAAIARELARRGYRLALFATSEGVETLAADLGALAVRGSVAEAADLERLVAATLARYGRVDAVVNNTGHPPTGELLGFTDEEWHGAVDLMLMNVVRMARLVTPAMEKAGRGAFVNISSCMAAEPNPAFPLSSVIRSALAGFTKLYVERYGAAGIRMNTVLPGFIDSYDHAEERLAAIPAGRFGSVGEIASTVAFLLSEEAGYVTGQSLLVDGGFVRGV